jgi:hypothetical protein
MQSELINGQLHFSELPGGHRRRRRNWDDLAALPTVIGSFRFRDSTRDGQARTTLAI